MRVFSRGGILNRLSCSRGASSAEYACLLSLLAMVVLPSLNMMTDGTASVFSRLSVLQSTPAAAPFGDPHGPNGPYGSNPNTVTTDPSAATGSSGNGPAKAGNFEGGGTSGSGATPPPVKHPDDDSNPHGPKNHDDSDHDGSGDDPGAERP